MTVNELMQATGLPQSTTYRQLLSLRRWGLVQPGELGYAPGPIGLQLGRGFDDASPLVQLARPDMQWLVQQTGESAGLVVAVNDSAICLEMVESPQALRCSFEKGRSVLLRRGASAKCLLAYQSDGQCPSWLQTHQRTGDAETHDATQAELDAIRRRGYACTVGEVDKDVWGASAPLFGSQNKVVGALTLMAPAVRVQERESLLIQQVVIAAARVTRRLQSD